MECLQHTFSVVRSAGSSKYNYINPVQRDTVSIGNSADDNVTIRFEVRISFLQLAYLTDLLLDK